MAPIQVPTKIKDWPASHDPDRPKTMTKSQRKTTKAVGHTMRRDTKINETGKPKTNKWGRVTVTTIDPDTGVALAVTKTASSGRIHHVADINSRGKITSEAITA